MTSPQRERDRTLVVRVAEELSRAPDVDDSHLQISVRGAILTLSGQVATSAGREAAKGAALRVPGIKAVSDKMVVSPDA
jgi:osmotically-inducible protein OsmY